MPKVTRTCRVCGKQFLVCRTPNMGNVLRWQDIACSWEHAEEYFAAVDAAQKAESQQNNDKDQGAGV